MQKRLSAGGLRALVGLMLLPALAACGQGQGADGGSETAPVVATSETAPAPTAAAPPASPEAALRTSAGPDGATVELTRVQVTGAIMTVELRFIPQPGKSVSQWMFNVNDASVIDDATSQRYGVLQDQEKKWMAAPISDGRVGVTIGRDAPAIIWLKFPAPPAASPTVSLNFPGVSPFDGVPVQR